MKAKNILLFAVVLFFLSKIKIRYNDTKIDYALKSDIDQVKKDISDLRAEIKAEINNQYFS